MREWPVYVDMRFDNGILVGPPLAKDRMPRSLAKANLQHCANPDNLPRWIWRKPNIYKW